MKNYIRLKDNSVFLNGEEIKKEVNDKGIWILRNPNCLFIHLEGVDTLLKGSWDGSSLDASLSNATIEVVLKNTKTNLNITACEGYVILEDVELLDTSSINKEVKVNLQKVQGILKLQ